MAGRRVQFLLGLALRVELVQAAATEDGGVDAPFFDDVGPGDERQ